MWRRVELGALQAECLLPQIAHLLHRAVGLCSHHDAFALDVHAAGTDQSTTLPTRSQQLVGGLADLDAAAWAGAFHAGGGVHGVAEQAELGHAVAHDAGSDGARMDANAHGDRLAVVGHECATRLPVNACIVDQLILDL
jgi:hypothetical protein